jgi:hypothetical protein
MKDGKMKDEKCEAGIQKPEVRISVQANWRLLFKPAPTGEKRN